MTAPTIVTQIPDQQSPAGVAISPFNAAIFFTDQDESDTLAFSISGAPSGTGFAVDADTGELAGTPTANDLAASFTLTATATAGDGATESIDIDFVAGDPPSEPAGATYFVRPAADGGDDSADGLTFETAWASSARANQVQWVGGSPGGQTIVRWAPGVYYGSTFNPQYSGNGPGEEIVWDIGSDGDVVFPGPATGYFEHVFILNAARQYVNMSRTATRRFVGDGGVVFGTGPGEIQAGDHPTAVARIRKGASLQGTNCELGFHLTRCAEWNGLNLSQNGTLRLRFSSDQHGTIDIPGGQDFGDTVQQTSATARTIFDGGDLGLELNRGGHGGGGARAGELVFRLMGFDGRWGGFIDTWSTVEPDGNRCLTFATRNARYCYIYDCVFNGSGKPIDQPLQESTKLEGRDNVIICTYFRAPHWNHIETARAEWSDYASHLYVGHCVFESSPGPIWEIRDYGNDGMTSDQANTPLGPLQLKNFIAIEPATENDRMIDLVCQSGNWEDQLTAVQGGTVQMATRDFDDLEVRLLGGGGPGTVSVNAALALPEGVFANLTATTDANLDSRPAASVNGDPSDLATELALDGGDTLSLGQGVALTTIAASDPGTGTTVHLTNARWLPDPLDGNADAGFFQTFQFYCGGNRTYTSKNKSLNRVVVSSSFTRSPGDPVHFRIPSGSSPHRGYPDQ